MNNFRGREEEKREEGLMVDFGRGGGKLRLRWQGRLPPSVANVISIGDQLMKINRVGTEM